MHFPFTSKFYSFIFVGRFQSYYNSYVKYKVVAITQALLKCYIEDFLNYSCAANLNCSSHSLNSWIVCPWFVNTVSHLILERINEDLRARLRDEEIDILYSKKVLGLSSPQALANTVWFKNMLHFGLRGCNDHELRWWDVVLRATWGFSKVQGVGLPCYSHYNLRIERFQGSENFSYSSLHLIFEYENFRFPSLA